MANVLRTYVSRGELEDDLALEIYETHLQAGLRVVELPLDKILQVAFDYRSTTYDAAFISLAVVHQVPLLTAERSTTPWVVKLGDLAETLH
jgi:predicted nucleic acid-binding protein